VRWNIGPREVSAEFLLKPFCRLGPTQYLTGVKAVPERPLDVGRWLRQIADDRCEDRCRFFLRSYRGLSNRHRSITRGACPSYAACRPFFGPPPPVVRDRRKDETDEHVSNGQQDDRGERLGNIQVLNRARRSRHRQERAASVVLFSCLSPFLAGAVTRCCSLRSAVRESGCIPPSPPSCPTYR
jgi:hypothetical protein